MEKFEANQIESKKSKENDNERKKREEELKRIRKEVEQITDGLGMPIDEGIKEAVAIFNAVGLYTSASCEGHIDRGISAPWIEISAPNEPEERFIGQQEVFEKIAKKYGITTEELKRGKIMAAYWEALEESSQKEETEDYKKWKEENKKLLKKAKALLEEFYRNRKVKSDTRLKIDWFTITSGKQYKGYIIRHFGTKKLSKKEKEKRLKKLEEYRSEMNAFAQFLKEKYMRGEI